MTVASQQTPHGSESQATGPVGTTCCTKSVSLSLYGSLALFLSVVLSVAGPALAQIRTEALLDSCKKKTQVWERVEGKLQPVGEKVDGFCHGYLVATWDVLTQSKAICVSGDKPAVDYLLSVVQTYVKADPKAVERGAAQVIRAAYARAFPCKEKPKGR